MAFDDSVKAGATSKVIEVMLRDSSTGQGKTGLSHSDVTASYVREGGTRTGITLAAGAAGDSYSSGKWAEVDSTNCKGIYQLHIPDAALAAGAEAVTITLQASGVIDKSIRIKLRATDVQDTVRLGLTALPNAAADAAGGLPISDAGGLDLDTLLNRLDATITSRLASASYITPPSAASIRSEIDSNSTQLAAIRNDTGSTLPALISGLNDLDSAAVQSACSAAITAYDPPTKAEMDSWFGGLNDLSSSDVQTAATAALNAYDPPKKSEMDAAFTEIKGSTWDSDTDTLENIYDNLGGGGGVADWTADEKSQIRHRLGIDGSTTAPSSNSPNLTVDLNSDQTGVTIGSVQGSVGSVLGSVGAISGVTFPPNFGSLDINSSGHISRVVLVDTCTTNTDMRGTDGANTTAPDNASIAAIKAVTDALPDGGALTTITADVSAAKTAAQATNTTLGTPVGVSLSADIASVKNDTQTLVSRITATLFRGITSLANWLGAMAGKQTPDATALAEINATGAGSGTFEGGASDSLEAIRDRGDAAWTTGAGGGGGGDATEAKQDIIIDHLTDIKGSTWSDTTDTLEAIRGAVDGLGIGAGAGEFTIVLPPIMESGVAVPDVDCVLTNSNASSSTGRTNRATADVNGVATFYLDAGTYYLWRQKAGYTFPNPKTLVVDSSGGYTIS